MSAWPKIWFVDDEKSILNSIRRIMRPLPFEVQYFHSFHEVNEAMLSTEDVGVCISDYRMPEKTGIEVLQSISEVFPKSNRYLLTGQGDLSMAIEALTKKVIHGYWVKPWENQQLVENVVAAIWDAWKKVWPPRILKWVLENNIPGAKGEVFHNLGHLLKEPSFLAAKEVAFQGELQEGQILWKNPVPGNQPELICFTPGPEIQLVAHHLGWEEVKNQLNFLIYSAFFTAINRKHISDLERNSVVDPASGLFNQPFFNQRLTETYHISQKYHRDFFGCLIKIKVEHLSKYCHQNSQEILLDRIGEIAKENLPKNSYLSRLKGFNFGGFFPEISEQDIRIALEKFLETLHDFEPELLVSTVLFQSPADKRSVRDWADEWKSLLDYCVKNHPGKILIKSAEKTEILDGKKDVDEVDRGGASE